MDLDLRPAPEKRDTLKYQIQLCRKCNYCWPDIGKERKREKIAEVLDKPLASDNLDALRRIGEFSKAKKAAEVAALYAKESILPKILDFQIKLIENKDTGRYTVADVLKTAK